MDTCGISITESRSFEQWIIISLTGKGGTPYFIQDILVISPSPIVANSPMTTGERSELWPSGYPTCFPSGNTNEVEFRDKTVQL